MMSLGESVQINRSEIDQWQTKIKFAMAIEKTMGTPRLLLY
jgi:hypothetical protein